MVGQLQQMGFNPQQRWMLGNGLSGQRRKAAFTPRAQANDPNARNPHALGIQGLDTDGQF
ncbi:hypothetical protein B723_22400 [Pseudomonas fluorescens NCIMB 11764]|uniref:Uncharacterized protein n=1 Tax=Pseudomonas fluorescens NCIMB 11764 TaxID=1221522 RepID=A0A0K1QU36_PSEFL|nr:hypothetical protein B723_22400 [Pseudomonas fluorescens NCIMB 11764]